MGYCSDKRGRGYMCAERQPELLRFRLVASSYRPPRAGESAGHSAKATSRGAVTTRVAGRTECLSVEKTTTQRFADGFRLRVYVKLVVNAADVIANRVQGNP